MVGRSDVRLGGTGGDGLYHRVRSEEQTHTSVMGVSGGTEKFLQKKCTLRVPNPERRDILEKYPLPKVPATRQAQLDPMLKLEISPTTKTADRQLTKVQARLLDSLAPMTSLLEAHNKGNKLDQKDVIQAVKMGVTLIGNANVHLLHLGRERIVSDINKTLLPIISDDSNFREAAPLLFGTEFAKKGKEMVEQVKAMQSTLHKKWSGNLRFFEEAPSRGAPTHITVGAEPKHFDSGRDHTRWAEAYIRHRKGLKSSSSKCQSPYPDNTDGSCGCKTINTARLPAASRKAKGSPRYLEGDHKRPVGGCHNKGLQDRLPVRTSPESETSHSTILRGTESINSGGDKGTSGQRSHYRSAQPSGRVLLKPVPCPKEGRWATPSNKPEGSKQYCTDRALQNGENPYPQRPH